MASHRFVVDKVGSTGSVVFTTVGTTDLSRSEFEDSLEEGQTVTVFEPLPDGATQPKVNPPKGSAAKRKG
jgi:hypothetical protein